jgi:hypothetical protein
MLCDFVKTPIQIHYTGAEFVNRIPVAKEGKLSSCPTSPTVRTQQ